VQGIVCLQKKVQQQKWITWRFDVNNQDIKISLGYDGHHIMGFRATKKPWVCPHMGEKKQTIPNFRQFFDANFWMTNSHGFFRYCIILPNMSVVKGECQTP
jgi:hypothetical protein